ncbi:MAG: hypothetical protein B7X48_01730 [Acidiphilium sp. 34-60-192]|nr:MAG: hypothetical protein B7X48_01730 [Acidiphilium sp. 34-60-192]
MSKAAIAHKNQAEAPVAVEGQPRPGEVQELKVSAHLMTLDAGLFCIVNEANPAAGMSGGLPGVRITPAPMAGDALEVISFRADGWLAGSGDAALVRVHRAPAQVLVTVYQRPNAPEAAPRLQVMRLAGSPAPVQTRGDVGAKFGTWLGEPGSGHWIEGIAVAAPEGIAAEDIAYQGVLGRGWLSPWVEAGAYCGSRGMALPLLGLRVRLQGEAAEQFDLKIEASFVDGSRVGPVGSDETCEAESLASLEAVKITLEPRRGRAGKARR